MMPPPAEHWPCKEEDCDAMNEILQDINVLQNAVQKCVGCGLPMQDQLDQLTARRKLLTDMKAAFFPGRE